MKALTDNIIEALKKRAYDQFDIIARQEIERAIVEIKEIEKNAEFEEVARVMMKHLGNPERYHPHHTTIITNSTAELVEGVQSAGKVLDYVPD